MNTLFLFIGFLTLLILVYTAVIGFEIVMDESNPWEEDLKEKDS